MKNVAKWPKKPLLVLITSGAAITFLTAAAPTQNAYVNDIPQIEINNPAQWSVKQVNQILCIINNTNYFNYLNQGPIAAQVDQNMCNTDGNPGQQANGSNNNGVPDYMNIIFDATRADANSAEQVKMWISGSVNNGSNQSTPVTIYGTINVTQSPTTDNPYGLFNLQFAGYPQSNPGNTPLMKGYIISQLLNGQVQLTSVQAMEGKLKNQVIVVGNGTTRGYGQVNFPGNNDQQSTYSMSYNPNNLYLQPQNASNICYNRNNTKSLVYQYGVYSNDGNRLINGTHSGYPFTYAQNGMSMQGFLNYYGASLPNGQIPANGDPVTYFDGGANNNGLQGTFVQFGGKMNVLNAQTLSLQQLAGMELNVPNMSSQPGANTNDIIKWDSSSQIFNKVGSQTCSQQGCTTNYTAPTPYGQSQFATEVMGSGNGAGTVPFWINGMGGGGNTQLQLFSGCNYNQASPTPQCSTYLAPTNNTNLVVWQNSLALPDSSAQPQTYYCVNQCPYQNTNTAQWVSGFPAMDGSGGAQSMINIPFITYNYDPVNYTLSIVDANSPYNGQIISSESQPNMSGPLLTLAQYNAITSNMTMPPNMALLYDGTTVNSYLQWQTGGGFNNFATIAAKNGSLLALDAPLQLKYTDTNGSVSFLQYSGFGNLQGIPGTCIDQNGNPTPNCGQVGTSWVPSYSIPSGSSLGDMSGQNTYWIKQLFTSVVLQPDQLTTCSNDSSLSSELSSAEALSLPDLSVWVDPSNIGSAPTNAPLSVINGIAVR